MERWLLTVEANCSDPSREEEFNDWYDTVHVPDILETPGFVRAIRYENTNPAEGQGKYVAMYEIETDDLARTLAEFDEIVNARAKQGRMSELVVAVGGGLYRQVCAPAKTKAKPKPKKKKK
jgi:hypothetical protein